MRAVKSVTIDSERRVIITFLDGSTETLYPNLICCDAEALRHIIKELLEEKADAVVQTISSVTVATFEDGADEALIRKLLVSIDPIQEGTGDPSPENVRPISGRTGLTVYRSGSDTNDPTEFPVTWETEAGTVYGGYVDVVSGKLVVDKRYALLSDPDKWVVYSGSTVNFAYTELFNDRLITSDSFSNLICSYMPVVSGATPTARWLGATSKQFGFKVDDLTLEQIKSDATDGKISICYSLATPTEIQLTPQEITTLLGTNNIWADSGDILELVYVADTKLYIGESQSATLGSGRQTIASPEIQPVLEKTWEEMPEAYKAETEEKETQEETEVERGE